MRLRGARAFSDGKLKLFPKVGDLSDLIPREELIDLLKEADEIYLSFDAPQVFTG